MGNTYLWSDGQTTAIATGLIAGTYSCTTNDSLNGCTSTTANVVIGEPSAIVVLGVVLDATSPIAGDGSASVSVSGGIPCETINQIGTGTGVTSGKGLFYTGWMDGVNRLILLLNY